MEQNQNVLLCLRPSVYLYNWPHTWTNRNHAKLSTWLDIMEKVNRNDSYEEFQLTLHEFAQMPEYVLSSLLRHHSLYDLYRGDGIWYPSREKKILHCVHNFNVEIGLWSLVISSLFSQIFQQNIYQVASKVFQRKKTRQETRAAYWRYQRLSKLKTGCRAESSWQKSSHFIQSRWRSTCVLPWEFSSSCPLFMMWWVSLGFNVVLVVFFRFHLIQKNLCFMAPLHFKTDGSNSHCLYQRTTSCSCLGA